jgi:hypothetical protein
MPKKYIVKLTDEEQKYLKGIVTKGKSPAYRIRHAHILLKANKDGPNWKDTQIAKAYNCHHITVENIRERFVTEGLDSALGRKKREIPPRKPLLDGKGEAHLIALSCSTPPKGRSSWTLQLLADKLVELKVVEHISTKTVERTLKKTT